MRRTKTVRIEVPEQYSVDGEVTERTDGTLEIEFSQDPTFDLVAAVAEAYGTRDIDIRSDVRNSGGCETCDFTYGVCVLHVRNATRKPEVL